MRRVRWDVQRDGSNASTTISKRRLRAGGIAVLGELMVGAAGRGYMPLQRGRTPESSLNGGPASGEENVRALPEYSLRKGGD